MPDVHQYGEVTCRGAKAKVSAKVLHATMWLVCSGDQPRLICPPAPLPIVITTTTKGSEGGVRKMVTGF